MKIAIPVNQQGEGAVIHDSFGRAPYILIYDSSSGESEYVKNEAATKTGGAGVKAAQFVVDQNAKALLTPQCGENAAALLNVAKVKIYKTGSSQVKENLAAFDKNELEELQEYNQGLHGK